MLLILLTIVSGLVVAPSALAADATVRRPVPSVVDSRLRAAAEALAKGADPAALRAPIDQRAPRVRRHLPGGALRPYVRADGRLQVHVQVRPGEDAAALADVLRARGVSVERVRPEDGMIQALVAPDALGQLAADRRVAAVRPPHYASPQIGSVTTEGDQVPLATAPGAIDAVTARTRLGAGGYSARLGRRIRVGVVSDGVAGLGRSKLSGDLPRDLIEGVTARSFIDTGSLVQSSPPDCLVQAEGRALLEIVHDLVPDAQLFFAAVETDLDYLDAVAWLRSQVDVIVDDIAFFNAGPYDGSSAVARVRTDSVAAGVAYAAAVGNSGQGHHRSVFSPDPSGPDSGTIGSIAHIFPPPNGSKRLPVTVVPFGQAVVFLQWNGTPFQGATSDFDLVAFSDTGGLVDASLDLQAGRPGDTPTEAVLLDNSRRGTAQTFGVQVQFCGQTTLQRTCNPTPLPPSAPTFEIFVVGGSASPLAPGDLVREGSIPNGPDAASIITAGAVKWSTGALEPFSSFGSPVPPDPLDVKPTVVGPDGVSTTVDNVRGLGGAGAPFFGTSAAAPHVGAVAAMLLALRPDLAPGPADTAGRAIRQQLAATALQLAGLAASNNQTGFGRVNAVTAVNGTPNGSLLIPATTLVTQDGGFTIIAGPLSSAGISAAADEPGVPIASFTLSNASGAGPVAIYGVTATASGTSGDEWADLLQACVRVAGAASPLGCGTFDADNGRLRVLFTTSGAPSPVTLALGGTQTFEVVYDFAVKPAGTTIVARASSPGTVALATLAPAAGGVLALGAGLICLQPWSRAGRRRRRGLLVAVALLAVSCGGSSGSSAPLAPLAPTCRAPTAANALGASKTVAAGPVDFSLLPLEPGDVIALRPNGGPDPLDDQPVVPTGAAVPGRTVTVQRP